MVGNPPSHASLTHSHKLTCSFKTDMLDEFDIEETPNTKKTSAGKDNAVKSGDAAIDDDFALELQAGMADLLGELEGSVGEQNKITILR